MFALIAFAAASTLHAPEALPAQTGIEPAAFGAAAVVDRFHAALGAGDGQGALLLMADDALVYESGHVEQGKAEYQAMHLDADMAFSRAVKEVTTRRSGHATGDFAWIASEGRTSGTFNGKAVDRATTETMLLRRDTGEWRILHIHWSSSAH
ncbi:MAG: YybH family protein [Sphingomicrobium sp.]